MKIIFITRIISNKDLNSDELRKIIKSVYASGIKNIYILSDKSRSSCKIENIPVIVVENPNPTSPISINTVLQIIKKSNIKPRAFLISSKEVELTKNHITRLIKEINDNKNLLVVGYKLEIADKKLNQELIKYYSNTNLAAYKVPWNTCAMWNYSLFDKYVSEFDEITFKKPHKKIIITIDGKDTSTDEQGMEDGLAIAKAVSNGKRRLYYMLLNLKVAWNVNVQEKQRHREKLERKEKVLRIFMTRNCYSINDLLTSQMPG